MSGQVDHANAVIAELGHEQSLPLQVDRHMIYAAAHITEQYLGLELERCLVCRFG